MDKMKQKDMASHLTNTNKLDINNRSFNAQENKYYDGILSGKEWHNYNTKQES